MGLSRFLKGCVTPFGQPAQRETNNQRDSMPSNKPSVKNQPDANGVYTIHRDWTRPHF